MSLMKSGWMIKPWKTSRFITSSKRLKTELRFFTYVAVAYVSSEDEYPLFAFSFTSRPKIAVCGKTINVASWSMTKPTKKWLAALSKGTLWGRGILWPWVCIFAMLKVRGEKDIAQRQIPRLRLFA